MRLRASLGLCFQRRALLLSGVLAVQITACSASDSPPAKTPALDGAAAMDSATQTEGADASVEGDAAVRGATDASVEGDAAVRGATDASVEGDAAVRGATDASKPRDAGLPEEMAAAMGPLTCSSYAGNCHANTGEPCCQGLTCLNGAVCCVSPGQIGAGTCIFDTDCCSGHCEDAGGFFGNCCNTAGQACQFDSDCCSGTCSGTTCQ
jgi:hypothetical protein